MTPEMLAELARVFDREAAAMHAEARRLEATAVKLEMRARDEAAREERGPDTEDMESGR